MTDLFLNEVARRMRLYFRFRAVLRDLRSMGVEERDDLDVSAADLHRIARQMTYGM